MPPLFSVPLLAWKIPSGPDMMILAVLVLVLFGAKKLPVFGRSLGRSMDEFRRAKDEFERQSQSLPEPPTPEERESAEDDPHAVVNFYLTLLFLLSVGFLIVTLAMQAMSQAESSAKAPASVTAPARPSHFIPAGPLHGAR